MKIEKINDNQIRCTLTREDLADRQIKLSELAYGTEKAKSLFRDMMLQAHDEVGFEADNIPLMIEAIPITADSIVLIITKVEDPEELDTRFSRFSPASSEDSNSGHNAPEITGADDILDLFHKLCESRAKDTPEKSKPEATPSDNDSSEPEDKTENSKGDEKLPPVNLIRIFSFPDLDTVIEASKGLSGLFDGQNTLYKDSTGEFLLVLHQSGAAPESFNKVCNILSEYGKGKACTMSREAYLSEHQEIIIKNCALQKLFLLA